MIRLLFFRFEIPPTLDGLIYFRYAIDLIIFGKFPPHYDIPNNGWPIFLSVFFMPLAENDFMDYARVQQLLTISISVLTIIVVYLLCTRFTTKQYSLFGTALFAFEPHIIQNSLLGISEPAYILLTTLSLFFSKSSDKKIICSSFAVAALATVIRYEGLMIFFILSIVFFAKYKKEPKSVLFYLFGVLIFVVVLFPVSYLRMQEYGYDGILSNFVGSVSIYKTEAIDYKDTYTGSFSYIITGFLNFFKFLGIVMLPILLFFVPIGVLMIFKKKEQHRLTIMISLIFLSLPALYAYSRGIQETRYLLVLLPLFSVLGTFALKKWLDTSERKNFILFSLIIIILTSSVIFVNLNLDIKHEKEAFIVSQYIVDHSTGVNQYYPESRYIHSAIIQKKWDVIKPYLQNKANSKLGVNEIIQEFPVIPSTDFTSLSDYIKNSRERGLSHIVVDDKIDRSQLLRDVFYHPENYEYLKKEFNSTELGFDYNVRIYRIDYSKMN
ncbi:MAG: hypothetical protein QXY15_08820 [Candidatus Nitrosotenuis sp.]